MRKTTKLTTLEKGPKNLWKRVPLHTPMQWQNPGEKAQAKTSNMYGYDTLL